jgi:hypothetical protein
MKAKKKAKAKPNCYTVGVRFIFGINHDKIYTYRVRNRSTVHLGQELVADTDNGSKVVVVVRIDKVRQDTQPFITYKHLTRKVAPL